jgi:glutathione S-transferase
MKLIEMARSPNPRRVRVFLAEKGIEVPTEQVDLGAQEHKTAEFRAMNPMCGVPVLAMDDGSYLCESVAICRYFEEVQPDPPLMGRGARERAEVEMWQRRMELKFLFPVMHAFRHTHPRMADLEVPQVPEWGEANRPRVLEMLEFLDRELAGRKFIAGGEYTIADITALVATDFVKPAKIERPENLTNLARWYDAVSSRPSAAA